MNGCVLKDIVNVNGTFWNDVKIGVNSISAADIAFNNFIEPKN
jgi:hypothetical protein